jgi:hypothetical protein
MEARAEPAGSWTTAPVPDDVGIDNVDIVV